MEIPPYRSKVLKLNGLSSRKVFSIVKLWLVYVNTLINKILYLRHFISENRLSTVAIYGIWLILAVSDLFVPIGGFHVAIAWQWFTDY